MKNIKFKSKKAILFDLDGTLIDSVPDLALAVNDMLTQLGKENYPQDIIRYWVGNGATVLVKRALLGYVNIDKSLDKELFERALDIFLTSYGKHLAEVTRTYPNVKETLSQLHQQGYRLVIITNKPSAFVLPILKSLQIDNLFEFYLGGDSLKEKKPNPLPLLYACDRLEISVDEAVMVGDSKNDIISANSAGMQSIGVTYGYNYGEPITHYQPTITVDDFGDIVALFGERDE